MRFLIEFLMKEIKIEKKISVMLNFNYFHFFKIFVSKYYCSKIVPFLRVMKLAIRFYKTYIFVTYIYNSAWRDAINAIRFNSCFIGLY